MAQEYQIKYGDTLSGIGAQFGLDYRQIASWNGINNPDRILAGNTLKLYDPNAAAAAPTAPTQPGQVTPYLNSQQEQDLIAQNQLKSPLLAPEVVGAKAELDLATSNLTNSTAQVPTAPNMEQAYSQMREQYGLEGLEADLNELKSAESETYARLRIRSNNEKGQRTGMGVISGRVSEIENQEREELDFVQRQITTRTNQVQSALSVINTMVQFKQMDFGNAMQTYNAEFNKTVKMYEIAKDNYKDIRDFKERENSRAEDAARANLQIYSNMITSGSLNYDTLDGASQLAISKLEIQSGLGIGFIKKLDIPLNARMKEMGTREDGYGNKYADVIIMGKDGSMTVKSTFLGKVPVASVGGGGGGGGGGSSRSSTSSSTASVAQKATDAANKSLGSYVSAATKALDGGAGWRVTWNRFKAAFPQLSSKDIDMKLGVPANRAGRDGWAWWQENGGTL